MRILIISSILLASTLAQAKSHYFIGGSEVNKGEAVIRSLEDPNIEVLVVNVSTKKASKESANLRKQSDAPISAIPNCN